MDTMGRCTKARERLASIMLAHSIPTGHGDSFDDLLSELDGWLSQRSAAPDLYAALTDALAGLRYVREHYHDERTASGDLYGVGFDRVEQVATAALAKARGDTP